MEAVDFMRESTFFLSAGIGPERPLIWFTVFYPGVLFTLALFRGTAAMGVILWWSTIPQFQYLFRCTLTYPQLLRV
jgi:hypothetical protein